MDTHNIINRVLTLTSGLSFDPPRALFAPIANDPSLAARLFFELSRARQPSAFSAVRAPIGPGYVPMPRIGLSGAPAGRGLTKDAAGWPKGTVTTAGGYHVVPEGGTNWSIFAPGQNAADKAHTRVWGDPHVDEKDGTRWDFSKSSDFVLGDGTRIAAKTSKENGQSVTTGLEIVNGADRVSIGDVDKGSPVVSRVKHDGYEWRAAHVARDPNRDTFHLRGDRENVHWVRERNGHIDGVVTGAKSVDGTYDQTIDRTSDPYLAASMRPVRGSRAWGNNVRSRLDDAQAQYWGQMAGPYGALPALANAAGLHLDDIRARFDADVRDFCFGGCRSVFDRPEAPFAAYAAMQGLLSRGSALQVQLLARLHFV